MERRPETAIPSAASDGRAAGVRSPLELVGGALHLSAKALVRDPRQLAGQLAGRLSAEDGPEVAALLGSARSPASSPWLRPLTPSLARPGGALRYTIRAHDDDVRAVAVLPDGVRALSGSDDCTLRLWDLRTGRVLREHRLVGERKRVWREHPADAETRESWEVLALAVSPDGRHAFFGGGDDHARLWEVEGWSEVRVFRGHSQPVVAVALTPDGRVAVTGSPDDTVRVWELATGEEIHVLEGHEDGVWAVATTPDGRHAVSGSEDGSVRLWSLATGEEVRRLRGRGGTVYAVAVTPDGRYLLAGSEDGAVRAWELGRVLGGRRRASIRPSHVLRGHVHGVHSLAVDPAGRLAFSGGADLMLKVWDLGTWTEATTLEGHGGWVKALDVSRDGRTLVSGDRGEHLFVWDLPRVGVTRGRPGHRAAVMDLAATPDGAVVVSVSADSSLKAWDGGSFTETLSVDGHREGICSVALSPDGARAVTGGRDGKLLLWSLPRGRRIRTLAVPGSFQEKRRVGPAETYENRVNAVVLTPDARDAVTGHTDGTIRAWELRGRLPWWLRLVRGVLHRRLERYRFEGHGEPVHSLALHPDGRRLLSGGGDGTVKVWSLETGGELRTFGGHADSVAHVEPTRDGRRLLSSSWDGGVIVRDLDGAGGSRSLAGHDDLVYQVTTTPSGTHALSASTDGTAVLWELAEGSAEARFTGDTGLTACVGLGDGRTFAVGDQAGGVHFLRAEGVEEIPSEGRGPAVGSGGRVGAGSSRARLPGGRTSVRPGVALHLAIWAVLTTLLLYGTAVQGARFLGWALGSLPPVDGLHSTFAAASVGWVFAYLLIGSQYSAENEWSMLGFWVTPLASYTLGRRALLLAWPSNIVVPLVAALAAARLGEIWWSGCFGGVFLAVFGAASLAGVWGYIRAMPELA